MDFKYKYTTYNSYNKSNVQCGISPPGTTPPPPVPGLTSPLAMVITPGYRTYTHQS